MEERVVTIDFNAVVAGERLDVCGANIVLGINEIPRIELIVPPTSGSGTPLKPDVSHPTIADFTDLYKKLEKEANEHSGRGNVDITITTNSTMNGVSVDELHINDWILTGVGLSSIDATSAPHMSVILHHPVFKLTWLGSIYETPKSNVEIEIAKKIGGTKPFLDIVQKTYEAYKGLEYFPITGIAPQYREQLGVGEFDPKQYFRDDTTKFGLFLDQPLNYEVTKRLAAAVGRLACPMSDGSSTWDMIVRSAGPILLSVIQDEQNNFSTEGTKGLVIEPTRPWKTDSVLTLDEKCCFWTEIPGMDMFKIGGVLARKLRIYETRLTNWANTISARPKDEKGMSDVFYTPNDKPPKLVDQRIMKTSAPVVLQQAFMEDGIVGGDIVTGFADTCQRRLNGFDEALRRYCRSVFEITYGSMNTAKAQMALGFRDADKRMILPGNTCKFMSDGKAIYHGYIRNVVHTMSTRGGCSTTVGMGYVRSELEVPERVPDGNHNYSYDV